MTSLFVRKSQYNKILFIYHIIYQILILLDKESKSSLYLIAPHIPGSVLHGAIFKSLHSNLQSVMNIIFAA